MLQQPILNDIIKFIPKIKAEWEVYYLRKKSFSIEGKDLTYDKNKISSKDFFSIRVLKDNKLGCSSCVELQKITDAFNAALILAENSDPDDFIQFPESDEIKKVDVFDEELEKVKHNLFDFLMEIQNGAFFDKRIKKLRNAEINISFEERGVINSKGLSIFNPFTNISAHIIAIAEDRDSQMGWAYRAERFLKNINFHEIGKEASKRALMLLNGERIKSFKGYVLLDAVVAAEFLELIAQSLSAENFLLGKSIFINKINETVINEEINIIDNGLIPERAGSSPFDAEGVPTENKILIEKGILKGLMHNCYTAKRMGLQRSTGNALRTDRGITVGPTNLYLDSIGKKLDFNNLLNYIDRGVYVLDVMGMHTANPVSGDFSVGISGVYVERGQLKSPIKEAVISSNIAEVFKNIKAIGNDLTFYGNIGAPTLLVEGIDISG
ncbi:MAG: TldD/PmbA family protein [Thermodesulfovibrio sp.]|nr:TldD/PmbA family protein [Thermodesulfovibrio sp.]